MSILNTTSPTPLSPSPAFVAELRQFFIEQVDEMNALSDTSTAFEGMDLVLSRLESWIDEREASQ